jgi:hypothetical protein
LSLLCFASSSEAAVFGFTALNTSDPNAVAASQFKMEVTDNLNGSVTFKFTNVGPLASSICDVYFDDGAYFGNPFGLAYSSGVIFTAGAAPGELPGGESIGFQTSAGLSADSDPAVQPNGVSNTVNGEEWLSIKFTLINGKTFNDVINGLAAGLAYQNQGQETIRVGLHVQGFANEGSLSFINGPILGGGGGTESETVPEPASLAIWGGLGVAGLIAARRRKKLAA